VRRRLPVVILGFAAAALALAGCSTPGPAAARHTSAAVARTSPSAAPDPSVTASPPVTASPSVTLPSTAAPTPAPAPGSAVSFPPGNGPLVVIDPGHNGGNASHPAEVNRLVPAGFGQTKACDTTGTNTDAGYPEHAFNWDVALRAKAILEQHGVRVILTRPDDGGVGPCVDQRAAIKNTSGVVATVAIHADGAPATGHGFHVNEDSRLPEGATPETMAASHRLTVAEHDALAAGSGLVPSTYIGSDGYVRRSDFATLNLARVPSTFLELGNMRNAGDAALQSSADGRQRVAAAVAAGLLAYLGTS
jgi:N-acetylmuramoyl-L-alanine amidase